MSRKILPSLLALTLGLVCQSYGTTWTFDFSSSDVSESLIVTTGAAVTTYGDGAGFLVTGVTGQRNGVAITGLTQAANDPALSPGYTTSSDGRWWFDNVVLTSGQFDLWGLLFSTADGKEYNLYNDHGQYIDGYFNTRTNCYELTKVAASVPESGATVALIGAALVGLATLRRRFVK